LVTIAVYSVVVDVVVVAAAAAVAGAADSVTVYGK